LRDYLKVIFRFVRGIILIVVGPLITFLLIVSLQIPENEISPSIVKKSILVLGSITILISLIGHVFVKIFSKGLIVTVTLSEIVYLFVFSFYALSDPANWQENLMWLPIMIISVAAISLPMAISISYGTGSIVKTLRNRQQETKEAGLS